MRKAAQNYVLFIVLLLFGLCEAVSGFVLWMVLPRGGGYMGGRGGETVAGGTFLWSRDIWLAVHNWVGVALILVVLIHMLLHWKWIIYRTKALFRQE